MSTYGDVRLRLAKLAPGIDFDLLDGWIQDRYVQILDRLEWNRIKKSGTITLASGTGTYALPSDCRILDSIRAATYPLTKMDRSTLNANDPGRTSTGAPSAYVWTFDDSSTPPKMQVELYPKPDATVDTDTLTVEYWAEAADFSGTTGSTIQVWVRDSALINGAMADICAWQDNTPKAQWYEMKFEAAVADMIRTECRNQGSKTIKMDPAYTRHRTRRWTR